jgi:hypothetical protein
MVAPTGVRMYVHTVLIEVLPGYCNVLERRGYGNARQVG